MAVLKIRKFGDLILKEKCIQIANIDYELEELVKNMAKTMYEAPGIGLAAPQVGVLKQLFICDIGDGLQVYVNPKILAIEGEDMDEEGCLSVPGINVPVKRAKKIKVVALNMNKKKVTFVANNLLLARAIQHEIDHLHGIIILDRTDSENRRRALSELNENAKRN